MSDDRGSVHDPIVNKSYHVSPAESEPSLHGHPPSALTVAALQETDAEPENALTLKGSRDSITSAPASLSYIDSLQKLDPEKFTEEDFFAVVPDDGAGGDVGERHFKWVREWFPIARVMFIIAFSVNLVGMGFTLAYKWKIGQEYAGTFSLCNIMLAVLTRCDPFMHTLFGIVIFLFKRWPPYWFRHAIAKSLLHFRDVHSGCATSGVAWLLVATIQAFQLGPHLIHPVILAFSIMAFSLLSTICISSHIAFREPYPNVFENIHRLVGWAALTTLWLVVGMGGSWLPVGQNFNGTRLLAKPDIFLALALTLCAIQPWAGIRKVAVKSEVLSPSVVLLRFRGSYPTGYFGLISRNCLKENHPFGITSVSRTSNEHYMCVVGQGDFTRDLIANPPTCLYTRSFKIVGLPILSSFFRSGLYIMTGSAIGVGLDIFMQRNPNCRWHLLWVSGNIDKTYGSTIVSDLKQSFKDEPDLYDERVTIWDSHLRGKPDLMQLTNDLVKQNHLEVVFVNRGIDIVQGCSKLGIPCYGPVWG